MAQEHAHERICIQRPHQIADLHRGLYEQCERVMTGDAAFIALLLPAQNREKSQNSSKIHCGVPIIGTPFLIRLHGQTVIIMVK